VLIAVSFWFVLACGLVLSILVFALNARGVSAATSGWILLTFCLITGAVQGIGLSRVSIAQSVGMWLGFIFLPSVAVFGISRLAFLRTKPWLLLIIGPISYLFAMIVTLTVANAIFA
jgi:hypothetical protein